MSKDTIYREDAIKAIEDRRCWLTLASQHRDMGRVLWDEYYIKFEDAIEALLLISSADRPQGEWINKCGNKVCTCSSCGEGYDHTYEWIERWNYCPNCGADMREREGE